ncbi:hypothetical protein QBC37DRAFT_435637 [Rhypophila decipiens]|uniref:Uncharacterized protein n=1 Tax=Rhypophila decipiens TaxID=261697 RepID=A0AAN7B040_9PEZI|nr:hypothetical protein QBC37DRAFT_435637 [Rhypophila decipiens]
MLLLWVLIIQSTLNWPLPYQALFPHTYQLRKPDKSEHNKTTMTQLPTIQIKPEMRDLYQKAVATPETITHAEKNLIIGRPPPDEEERLCLAKVNLTVPQLREKAITHPEQLTPLEARIIMHGAGYDPAQHWAVDRLEKSLSMRKEDRNLELDARGAVKTRDELRAWMNAEDRLAAWGKERLEELAAKRGHNLSKWPYNRW